MPSPHPLPAAALELPPLPYQTPPQWALLVCQHRDRLLVDQAHLEKKAAAAAVAFLFRWSPTAELQRGLSALAREELLHFERCLRLLQQRGIAYTKQRPAAYAAELKRALAVQMPARLVDELLLAAIVEARSCERMAMLAEALAPVDRELAEFYRDLVAAEARHADLYSAAAAELVDEAMLRERWRLLGAHEAAVLQALPFTAQLHGGLLPAAVAEPPGVG